LDQKKFPEAKPYSPEEMKKGTPILLKANLVFGELETYADVLTKVEEISSQRKHNYAPTLVVGTYKIYKEQKLQLAFIGHILSKFQKEKPSTGTIIGGGDKSHKIKLEPLYKEVEQTLRKLKNWISSQEPEVPHLILNKHCLYCPFQKECEAKAKEQDHLSLLKRMNEKEIIKQNNRGIFTTKQYSYTYRPRKRKNAKGERIIRHSHALKALAIKDKKIYIVEKSKISMSNIMIFLDIEGIPDQNFYYLIGIVIIDHDSIKKLSLWANTKDEEKEIWKKFLIVIENYNEFTLFHYGNYEIKFIEKMSKKYSEEKNETIEKIIINSVNVLSLIYANIYFPTYSNSLKDIGLYLEYQWSEANATGIQSIIWRHKWELTNNKELKQKLITYNIEDCFALKRITEEIVNISNEDMENSRIDIALTDDIKIEKNYAYHFGDVEFLTNGL